MSLHLAIINPVNEWQILELTEGAARMRWTANDHLLVEVLLLLMSIANANGHSMQSIYIKIRV
jgi:hypothetical protein